MSSGAKCRVYQKGHEEWYYDLQEWPYGGNEVYTTHGPFPDYDATADHLIRHHQEPTFREVKALPGCPHDKLRKVEVVRVGHDPNDYFCGRCGSRLANLSYAEWRRGVLPLLRQYAIEDRDDGFLASLFATHKTPAQAAFLVRNARQRETVRSVLAAKRAALATSGNRNEHGGPKVAGSDG